jgi:[ribosomal protein S18]-alanine N-acetyltransferase
MIQVRPARREDKQFMQILERASEGAAHWAENVYDSLFELGSPRVALVSERQDELAGFVVAAQAAGVWEIENVVVAPESRRKGIGSLLLMTLLDQVRARGGREILLEVRDSNLAARRLYEGAGFQENGRRPAYYRNPDEDAVLYRLHLK